MFAKHLEIQNLSHDLRNSPVLITTYTPKKLSSGTLFTIAGFITAACYEFIISFVHKSDVILDLHCYPTTNEIFRSFRSNEKWSYRYSGSTNHPKFQVPGFFQIEIFYVSNNFWVYVNNEYFCIFPCTKSTLGQVLICGNIWNSTISYRNVDKFPRLLRTAVVPIRSHLKFNQMLQVPFNGLLSEKFNENSSIFIYGFLPFYSTGFSVNFQIGAYIYPERCIVFQFKFDISDGCYIVLDSFENVTGTKRERIPLRNSELMRPGRNFLLEIQANAADHYEIWIDNFLVSLFRMQSKEIFDVVHINGSVCVLDCFQNHEKISISLT